MIIYKSKEEIELMRASGKILRKVLDKLSKYIKPGISTYELDKIAEDIILSNNAKPSFKGYYGFPATLCTSINEVLIHGIPSKKEILKEGDIISIDCGVFYKGFHSDAAETFAVGKISQEKQKLIEVTRKSFFKGLEFASPAYRLFDISAAIEEYVKSNGFFVVKEYTGHGIGRNLHEEPSVPNYGKHGTGIKLKEGLALAIEPMVLIGSDRVFTKSDGWTVVSKNYKPTAHYENTIVITKNGYDILTI